MSNHKWEALLRQRDTTWDYAESIHWELKQPFNDRHGNRQNQEYENPGIVEVVLSQYAEDFAGDAQAKPYPTS